MKLKEPQEYLENRLRTLTDRIHHIESETIKKLALIASVKDVARGDSFCQQGVPDNNITFIDKGIFRMYHIFDGTDKTLAFACEGDPFMSVSTFLTGQPTEFTLEAVEDSRIITIPNNLFIDLCNTTDLNNWFRRALLGQIYAVERRCVWFGNHDAYSRYSKLIELRSEIIHRIPLKYVASYLGITQETLSRIRAKYFRTRQEINITDAPTHPL